MLGLWVWATLTEAVFVYLHVRHPGTLFLGSFHQGLLKNAVQKIQKLSESPVTSHVVAKICANNSTNVINQTPMHAPISMGLKMGDKVNLATR